MLIHLETNTFELKKPFRLVDALDGQHVGLVRDHEHNPRSRGGHEAP